MASNKNTDPPTQPGLSARLGLASMRGRYLYATSAFLVLVVAAAWFADVKVRDASRNSDVHFSERDALHERLRTVENDLWQAEIGLQNFMLVPAADQHSAVRESLERATNDAIRLTADEWVRKTPLAHASSSQLAEHLSLLRTEADRLMGIRTDPSQLFPAMPILLAKMAPKHTEFSTAARLAMDEADDPSDPEQVVIRQLFAEARYSSAQMVSAFRMFVANRLGVFGDPETAMRAQARNVSFYAEMVERNLTHLATVEKHGRFGFQQSDSIRVMRSVHVDWLRTYKEVSAIYTSERWRTDVPLLRDTVQPLFEKAWAAARVVDSALRDSAAESASTLAAVSDRLSLAIWGLTLLCLVMIAAGYALFERTIRLPMARVAEALRAEAAGHSDVQLHSASTVETNNLITAFDTMREQVHSRQVRLETILDNAAEGIVTFGENGTIERFNKAAERLFGYTESEIVGKDIGLLIQPSLGERRDGYVDHFMRHEIARLIGHEGEVVGRHKDGTTFAMALKISKIAIEGQPLYTGLVADISERKAMVEHLKEMAEHDGLTGLYNRTYFQQELERVVERGRRAQGSTSALLYIDLDNFKYVNDTLGHAAGDRLLIEVASILNKRARKSDLISRFGGDEFTVLLYDIKPELALHTAESFRQRLSDYAFLHNGEHVTIGCSIGISNIGTETKSAEHALSQADIACHIAKRGGRNQVHAFRASDIENVTTMSLDMGWSRRIKDAIENNRFALACQPIISTADRGIHAYEVLIRMLDEKNGLIMPSGFLPTAERFGLSTDIDRWVIVNAIETLKAQRQTMPGLRYSINLSGQTLSNPAVCDLVHQKLQETGLEPSALIFEVTETVAIADMAAAQSFLSRLRALGCQTALDDFGSGMSSFAYLRDLPVDIVKIDGRFVKNLAANSVDQAMVKAMNEIAHALGKQTVAEFVENEESFQLLIQYGVDYGQGYHLGRPDVNLPCQAIAEHAGKPGLCRIG